MKNQHEKLIAKISRIADSRGLDVRTNYSGRGMFGSRCIGFVGDDMTCAALAGLVQRKTGHTARKDNMGLGTIYYFPTITTE